MTGRMTIRFAMEFVAKNYYPSFSYYGSQKYRRAHQALWRKMTSAIYFDNFAM